MKRYKLALAGLLVGFGALLVGTTTATAWSNSFQSSDDTVLVAAGETHQGSLYATGLYVEIDGTVEGDLYCAAQDVVVTGTVRGDMLCAAQNITVEGTVSEDARLAAQDVTVRGAVDGTLTAFAQGLTVDTDAQVGADLNGAAQTIRMRGAVGRDVAIGGQRLQLDGQVGGNVDVAVENLSIGTDGEIEGSLSYTAAREQSVSDGAVAGEVTYHPSDAHERDAGFGIAGAVAALLSMLLVAFVIVLLAPRFVNRSHELLLASPLQTILIGFTVVFAAPIVATFLLVSVVFAPLAFILLLAWLLVLALSGTFFAYFVGASLLRGQSNVLLRMAGGLVIVFILMLIPGINALMFLALSVVGSGMLVGALVHNYRRPEYQLVADDTDKPVKKPSSRSSKK